MLIQNERIICIRFCPFQMVSPLRFHNLSRLWVCLKDNLDAAQTKTDGESGLHVTQLIYLSKMLSSSQFCTLLFSGGGVPLRVRDGGLGSVQRLHWPQLWRALPPRGCACALWSLCWRARGPRGQSPGLHHLRARGGQDGAQDSQAAPRQGQPHVPDLAVLLLDGHGNYRMDLIIIGQLSHYYYWGNTVLIDFWCARADRIFDYYSIANNERVLLWCAGGA